MKLKTLIYFIILTTSISVFGQTKDFKINGVTFTFKEVNEESNKFLELYRGDNRLLTHTIFKEEGDCSSIHIQLGKYKITGSKIIFYSYWGSTDRMPNLILPFGFRKQIYSVDSAGVLKLIDSQIYMENYVKTKNKEFLEENGWKHKGLKYLNNTTKNEFEQRILDDYIKNIENEYNANFVLNEKKEELEKKVRNILKKEIKEHTGYWKEGEIYGKVRK